MEMMKKSRKPGTWKAVTTKEEFFCVCGGCDFRIMRENDDILLVCSICDDSYYINYENLEVILV